MAPKYRVVWYEWVSMHGGAFGRLSRAHEPSRGAVHGGRVLRYAHPPPDPKPIRRLSRNDVRLLYDACDVWGTFCCVGCVLLVPGLSCMLAPALTPVPETLQRFGLECQLLPRQPFETVTADLKRSRYAVACSCMRVSVAWCSPLLRSGMPCV